MKRILTAFVSLCLAASLCLSAFAASKGSFDHFQPVNTFSEESFADVSGWFAPYVSTVYSMGLMQGSINTYGERAFHPDGAITLAEIITLADRIHSTYYNDGEPFLQGSPWYQTYVDYAVEKAFLPPQTNTKIILFPPHGRNVPAFWPAPYRKQHIHRLTRWN